MAKNTKTNTETNTETNNITVKTKEEVKNMAITNKIDFAVIIAVEGGNPNGDIDSNRPRTIDYNGCEFGFITDVCMKRKIRNRLQDMEYDILVQADDRCTDEAKTLRERIMKEGFDKIKDKEERIRAVCLKYADVRAFGTVATYLTENFNVRGPVTIRNVESFDPIEIESQDITSGFHRGDKDDKEYKAKESSSIGKKHFVKFGLYKLFGSINVQMAEKTGFSADDAAALKEALRTLFVNDESAARPAGSCEVVKVFWFEHNCKIGQYSPAKIDRAITAKLVDGVTTPMSIDDYEITYNELEGLKYEIIDGF